MAFLPAFSIMSENEGAGLLLKTWQRVVSCRKNSKSKNVKSSGDSGLKICLQNLYLHYYEFCFFAVWICGSFLKPPCFDTGVNRFYVLIYLWHAPILRWTPLSSKALFSHGRKRVGLETRRPDR